MAKLAVVIGCNYPGTMAELKGCINDVNRVKIWLINKYGFLEENVVVLIDTDPAFTQPTGKNILSELSSLVEKARPGDVLFVHYSGHGTRIFTENPEEDDTGGFKECIVPADFNLITSDDFRKIVDKVPRDCIITIVADSCYSGGLIKAAKEQIGDSTKKECSQFGFIVEFILSWFRNQRIKPHGVPGDYYSYVKNRSLPISTLIDILKLKTGKDDIDEGNLMHTLYDMFGEDASPEVKNSIEFGLDSLQHGGGESGGYDENLGMLGKQESYSRSTSSSIPDRGILLSASQSDQEAEELSFSGNPNEVYGAYSNAVVTIIEETHDRVTNREVVLDARKKLEWQHFTQKPGLYCNDYHVNDPFVCDLIEAQLKVLSPGLCTEGEGSCCCDDGVSMDVISAPTALAS